MWVSYNDNIIISKYILARIIYWLIKIMWVSYNDNIIISKYILARIIYWLIKIYTS